MKPAQKQNNVALLILASIVLTAPLGGCVTAALVDNYAAGVFQRDDINMTDRNYAAADYLVQQGKTFIGRRDLVKAVPLKDLDEQYVTATIGKLIPEQIGVRLSQLGYVVDIADVTTGADTNYLKPADASLSKNAKFILAGTYVRQQRTLDVKLRLTQLSTGRVIASYDYTLPLSREIARLAEPTPRIMKVQP